MKTPKLNPNSIFFLAAIGLVADLTEILGQSGTILFMKWLLSNWPWLFLVLTVGAFLITVAIITKKYKKLERHAKRMVNSVVAYLQEKFSSSELSFDNYYGIDRILNAEGDCEHEIFARIRAASDRPVFESVQYHSVERGTLSYHEFCESLSCEGADVEPVEFSRIENEDVFSFKLVFPRAVTNIDPLEYRLRYRSVKAYPLDRKDLNAGVHIAIPTAVTSGKVTLPDGWQFKARRIVVQNPGGLEQPCDDQFFRNTDANVIEWSIPKPKLHAFYNVYFSARRLYRRQVY